MWIFLSDAFLSIVADRDAFDQLLVRARFRGDVECVFPEAVVVEGAGTDYAFRARVTRERVAQVLAQRAASIAATNFKDSVEAPWRHDAYLDVWAAMARAGRRHGR